MSPFDAYLRRQEVRRQRRRIEACPEWGQVEALNELWRCEQPWTEDDERRFRELVSDARVRK